MPYKDQEEQKNYNKQYYIKNKEKSQKNAKIHYLKNTQKYLTSSKKRYEEKKESILLYCHERYLKNKDKIKIVQDIWTAKNKDKVKEIKKRYRIKNREKLKKAGKEYAKKIRLERPDECRKKRNLWRKNNPEKVKEEKLKSRFNISLKNYNDMLKNQNNQCGICKTEFDFKNKNSPEYPCVDHCHKTLKVRGILCHKCNSGLGGFQDDSLILEKALIWLNNKKLIVKKNDFKISKNLENKKYYLKKIYKITPIDLLNMLNYQNYKCGICNKDFPQESKGHVYNIDHCHVTQKIRGILCPQCNRSLGLLNDNPNHIKNGITWLKRGL